MIVAWLVAWPQAFAQKSSDAPPAETSEPETQAEEATVREVKAGRVIEEIVVTARKTEENIQDVPVSITALSGEDLVQTSTFEMKELGLRVPNLVTQYGANQPTALTFQIRGQVQGDIVGTLDPSIGFYDDGVYVARPHGSVLGGGPDFVQKTLTNAPREFGGDVTYRF